MRTARTTSLALELLGVPVRVHCEDKEHAERVRLCYALSTSNGGPNPVDAELIRDADAWRVRVSGREPRHADDWTSAVRVLNHELMHAVMRTNRSLYYVHAAVVEADGRGIVLPGLSLAGKSTLALAFVRAGARYLSDELLAFDPASEQALAFPRAPKIRDECVAYFPDLAARFVGTGEGRFLPFDALGAEALVASASVDAVVVPHWSGVEGATELEELSPGAALLALTSSSLNFGMRGPASLDCLTALVRDARAFHLNWREPHGAVERVLAALETPRRES